MILAHYGRWTPLEELRVRCGISRDGSKASNLVQAAREYGLIARGFRLEIKRLFDIPFPMILFWNFNHFVVLEGIRGDRVYINDPAEGARRITKEELDRSLTGICLGFQPGPDFRKAGSPPSALRGLFSRLGHAHGALAFVLAATLLLVIPGLAIPTFSKIFVDDVLIPRDERLVIPLLLGLGVAAVLQGTLTWLQQHCIARLESRLSLTISSRYFWHVVTLPMTFFSQRFAGDIAGRGASGDRIAQVISSQLATSAVGMITMAVYATVMMLYDPVLTLAVFGLITLNIVALQIVSRARESGNRRLLKEQGKLSGALVHGLHMIETLKANGSESEFFTRWSGIQANALTARQELGLLSNLLGVAPSLLSSLTTIAVLGIGGLRIVEGALTIGGLVAFQALSRSFAQPIDGLVRFGADLQTVKGELSRIDDVMRHEPEPRTLRGLDGQRLDNLPSARGLLEMSGISFGYNAKEPPAIEDFSLTVRPGQRVALVGASGSGKSTIGRIACGFLAPWSGAVRIDGREIAAIPPSHLAGMVSYVDQEVVLFQGTIRDNVTLWNPGISDFDVTGALRDAAVHEDVVSRGNRYDSVVDEYGRNFSGGQRQRLEIARALVVNPALLVLDEATAALDPVTEQLIDDRLRRRGCACLIIAHRLSTIKDADEIIVLERGRVIERGAHVELIARDGPYRKLITAG